MSSRTAQASRAIAKAWENERQLVSNGKGTRDWTPEQQEDILSSGKAHDADGKAFEGHHMQSVSVKPEFQGEPGNIQFLSRDEHLIAHGGSYQNPTNGYFNPSDGITTDFGDGAFIPCPVIELSEPIIGIEPLTPDALENNGLGSKSNGCAGENAGPHQSSTAPSRGRPNPHVAVPSPTVSSPQEESQSRGIFGWIRDKVAAGVDAVRDWWDDNGDIVKGVAKELGPEALSLLGGIVQAKMESDLEALERERDAYASGSRHHDSQDSASSLPGTVEKTDGVPGAPSADDMDTDDGGLGSPKSPHLRHGHLSHYWTGPKDGKRVRIEKWIDDIQVHGDHDSEEPNDEEE